DDEAAVAQGRDAGQRRFGKPRPIRPARARFQPKLLAATDHFGNSDRATAQSVADLLDFGGDAMNAQQDHQAGKPGVEGRFLRISSHSVLNSRSFGTDQFPFRSPLDRLQMRREGGSDCGSTPTQPTQLAMTGSPPPECQESEHLHEFRPNGSFSLPAATKSLSLIANFEFCSTRP